VSVVSRETGLLKELELDVSRETAVWLTNFLLPGFVTPG
jgi:hypothetical protein